MLEPTNRLIMAFVRERSPRECVCGIVHAAAKHGNTRQKLLHWCVSCYLGHNSDVEVFPGADIYLDQLATPVRCIACGNAMSVRSRVWTSSTS